MKCFDAPITTQKISALYEVPFLKKSGKYAKNDNFFRNDHFCGVFLIFSEMGLCRELRFFALWSVHQNASFKLSNSPVAWFSFEIFKKYFLFYHIKLHLKTPGHQVNPQFWDKWVKKVPRLEELGSWNSEKMFSRHNMSHVTCHVRVTCHVSCVMCHVSHVMCHIKKNT